MFYIISPSFGYPLLYLSCTFSKTTTVNWPIAVTNSASAYESKFEVTVNKESKESYNIYISSIIELSTLSYFD